MTRVLGIDIGTTATKAVVLDAGRGIVAEAARTSQLHSPHAGWAEEDPDQWWGNVVALTRELPVDDVAAVGVSGMVPCVIPLGGDGMPLRASIQQNDARAREEVVELASELAEDDILQRTGSPISQQSVAPTLRWLQRHEPEVWSATRAIVGSYDLIARRLTDSDHVERNWALESGLWDLRADDWAADVCAAVDLDAGMLGRPRAASEVVGEVTRPAAEQTGIPAGTPVVAGSADHVASAFAAGLIVEGDLLVKLGGAGDILLATTEPIVDERLYLDHHLVPGAWLPNGCMAASGSLIRWFEAQLGRGSSLAELDAEAEASVAGANGVVVLPYFLGEKTPVNDPAARGTFAGVHLGHTRGDMFRAVLESIAYGFRHHLEVFEQRGLEVGRVRVTNGGARSRLWKQVTADVLGRSLEVPAATGGSALGAAFAAGIGAGVFADWGEIERLVEVERVIEPDPASVDAHDEGYATYRELYERIGPLYRARATAPEVGVA